MIFIMGGNGFVGSAFVRWCESHEVAFRVIDRDSYASLSGQSCSIFVNANGNSRKPLATREPMTDFDASVRSVRASLVDFKYDVYLHLSSCDVYADCSSAKHTREDVTPAPHTQSPYGFHKSLAEQCVQHAAKQWLVARLGGFVGPGLKKNAIYDILHGGPLWLDTQSELQFMHTDDCARILMDLAHSSVAKNRVLNVCGNGTVKLADVIGMVGRDVTVQPQSPKVTYDVSIGALQALTDVPLTKSVVEKFVNAYQRDHHG